jgi:phage terminase large subunit-like protein
MAGGKKSTTSPDPVEGYARAVVDGAVVAGRLVRLAAQRHLDDLRDGPARGLRWDLEAALRAIGFFSYLRHSKGEFAGKPFEMQPWQAFCVGSVYGWKRADGTRRFRRSGIWVPKKNGKSTMVAGLVLYGLVADGEAGAEAYGAAADKFQASLVFNEVRAMVAQTPALAQRLRVVDTTKRVVFEQANSVYTVLSKDSRKTGHGINASLCVIDELHVVDRELYDTLRYAGAARQQPLLNEISTAGNDKDSLGYERYTYAKRLLLGEIVDDETFAYVAEADSNEQWQEPEQWRKANPSLGVTISLESFEGDFREAMNSPPATQANFKQLRLNLWQDSVYAWIPLDKWDECAGKLPDLTGAPCWGALDLSSKSDLTAWVRVYKVDEEFWLVPYFWAPENGDKRRHEANRTLLRPWMDKGLIERCPLDTIDQRMVLRRVLDDCEGERVREVAVDEWNAEWIIQSLMGEGVKVLAFAQNTRNYNEPMKEFERLVYEKKIRHDGNPVLRWCVANTVVYADPNGNVRPDKKHSSDRIDGAVASVMALARATLGDGGESMYETQGLGYV